MSDPRQQFDHYCGNDSHELGMTWSDERDEKNDLVEKFVEFCVRCGRLWTIEVDSREVALSDLDRISRRIPEIVIERSNEA